MGVRRRLLAGRPPLLLLLVPLLLRLRLLLWLVPPLVPLSLRFRLSPLQQLLPKSLRSLLLLRFRLPCTYTCTYSRITIHVYSEYTYVYNRFISHAHACLFLRCFLRYYNSRVEIIWGIAPVRPGPYYGYLSPSGAGPKQALSLLY